MEVSKVAVAQFTVVGLKESFAKAVTELARAAAMAEGYEVVAAEGLADSDRVSALLKASEAGAQLLITGALIGFKGDLILWVSVLEVPDGSPVYQDKVRLHAKDEIQEGIQAIIRAARKKDRRAQDYYEEIILEEKGITSAKSSYITAGLLMGAVVPVFQSLGRGGALNGGEIFLNYETPFWTGRLGTGFFRSDSSAMMPIGFIETLYSPRGNKDISPYVGGSAGFAYFKTWQQEPDTLDASTFGWLLRIKGGVMFFRAYEVRLLVEGGYAFLASQVERLGKFPSGFYLSVGFNFQTATPFI